MVGGVIMIKFYCSVDENRHIIDSESGEKIIPDKQYHYFFILDAVADADILSKSPEYKVIDNSPFDRQIVLIESL